MLLTEKSIEHGRLKIGKVYMMNLIFHHIKDERYGTENTQNHQGRTGITR